jgi:hypothetical protein
MKSETPSYCTVRNGHLQPVAEFKSWRVVYSTRPMLLKYTGCRVAAVPWASTTLEEKMDPPAFVERKEAEQSI